MREEANKSNKVPMLRERVDRLRDKLIFLKREVIQDQCLMRSSSLAFSSLLAIVPLTAFIFALFTGFGAFEDVKTEFRKLLIRFLVPTRQDEILLYMDNFIENSRAMGVVGLLLFAFTSIFLLNGIAENINAVWGSTSKLSFFRKFSLYISILVFGTLLIGVGFSFIRSYGSTFTAIGAPSPIIKTALVIVPSLIVFLIHWLIIYSIPSAKVRLVSSLIAAASGTILWEAARFIFVDATNYILRMSVLYGSLASIPIFLVWLAIQWFIILVAVEIAYVDQHSSYRWVHDEEGNSLPSSQLSMGICLYSAILRNFYRGERPYSLRSLAHKHSLAPNDTETYLRRLRDAGLITFTHSGPSVVVPAKEPATIDFEELLSALFGNKWSDGKAPDSDAHTITRRFFQRGAADFADRKVMDMITPKSQENEEDVP